MFRSFAGPALIAALLLGGAGCKQGEGERCQLDDDCADGLVCNQATSTCQTTRTSGGDAGFQVDARVPLPDAPINVIDAAIVIDAGIDASPVDASTPDAAP